MLRSLTPIAALAFLFAAAPAHAAHTYSATFSGTQTTTWSTDASGTCTGDDGETHPYTGKGSGTSNLTFKTRKASTVVAFQQGRTSRWGFNFQASPVIATGRDKAPYVQGTRTGTYSTTCPNSEILTRTAQTDGCGKRDFQLDVKANLNLPNVGKPGELTLEALELGKGTGAKWSDACPYFVELDRFRAHPDDDPAHHIPAGGLLTVRKKVGSDRLRQGKALTVKGERTMPYDQTITADGITTHVRGKTVVRWTLKLTPKR